MISLTVPGYARCVCRSIAHARAIYLGLRDHEERQGRGGASEFPDGVVDVVVGNIRPLNKVYRVSYNGRVWFGAKYSPEEEELSDQSMAFWTEHAV